jgi:acetoin:2,6-dichlorophenolindophenol oxidoreductase subunit beta
MSTTTMVDAVNKALHDAMAEDESVIVFGEDVGDREGGGVCMATKGLSTKFGDRRVRSTPISEQAIVGAAIGASMVGMKPVAEIMLMNFTTVAMDMIVNHAAKLRFMSGGQTGVPITIRTMTGAGLSNGGQHSDFLEAWFAHTPGLKVVIPSNAADAYGLLLSCIDDPDPCIFVESLGLYWAQGPAPEPGKRIPLGSARIARQGKDVSVITYGPQVAVALGVAETLKDQIDVEVIDLRTVSPLDELVIFQSVGKTGRAIVAHEAVKSGGVGAEIASRINETLFNKLKAPVKRLGGKFSPVPFSKSLETAFLPSAADMRNAIQSICNQPADSPKR